MGVLLGGLLAALSQAAGFLFSLLGVLIYMIAIFTGVNAAGLLQMDQARGLPPRPLVDALVAGLLCIPKLIVLGLALFAVEIAVFIVLAILLLICKIPFLGPLLFVVVFPVSVVVGGITVCGVLLCGVLSLPAIWQGLTIGRALTQTLAIARSRLVESVLLLVFLGFLCFCVSVIVFGVLGAGLAPTLVMSGSMLGFGGGMGSAAAMMMGGGGGGIIVAGAIGAALLWVLALALVGQVYLLGLSIVYLRVTEGLDLDATKAALRAGVDEARRRSASFGDKTGSAPVGTAGAGVAAGVAGAAGLAGAAAYAAPPPPSFEAMQSAAFGGPPIVDASRPDTTQPLAYRATPAFDATVAGPADIDLSFDEATPGVIDLPFDEPPALAAAPAPAPAFVAPSVAAPATPAPLAAEDPATVIVPAKATPSYASPPAWTPPPAQPPVAAPPPPPAPPLVTTCPQCLSAVASGDLFCGVCGFRLK